MRAGGEPSNSPADRAAATRPPLRGCDHGTLPSCSPGANCLTGKTPRSPSTPSHKNIPLYRNSDLAYLSPIPAQQRGGRTSSRTRAGVRWTRAALKAGLCVQGEMNLVSMVRAAIDGRRSSLADPLATQGSSRTAKPCGPGRRCYGQAFAKASSRQPARCPRFRGGDGGKKELVSGESAA
jgi:hypothetical protein